MGVSDGRVGLVTGAARGIGSLIASALLDQGASLLLFDRDAAASEEICARLGTDYASRVIAVEGDVS